MTVSARSEHPRGAAAARRLRERARRYLAALRQVDAELSILVVDDRAMLRLNRAWRGKDSATDVLSFPSQGPAAGRLLGDVVISLDTARRAARSAGRTLGGELDRYLAHGLLHLLGHDHHRAADARRMSAAEDALVGEGMVSAARRGRSRARARLASGGEGASRSATRDPRLADRGPPAASRKPRDLLALALETASGARLGSGGGTRSR